MATPPALLAYLGGSISLDALPDVLVFDDDLWQAMNDLWQRSVARLSEGIVVEWGGLLELRHGHLRLNDERQTRNSFIIPRSAFIIPPWVHRP